MSLCNQAVGMPIGGGLEEPHVTGTAAEDSGLSAWAAPRISSEDHRTLGYMDQQRTQQTRNVFDEGNRDAWRRLFLVPGGRV